MFYENESSDYYTKPSAKKVKVSHASHNIEKAHISLSQLEDPADRQQLISLETFIDETVEHGCSLLQQDLFSCRHTAWKPSLRDW